MMQLLLGPGGALVLATIAWAMERTAHRETRKECAAERRETAEALKDMTAALAEATRQMTSRR